MKNSSNKKRTAGTAARVFALGVGLTASIVALSGMVATGCKESGATPDTGGKGGRGMRGDGGLIFAVDTYEVKAQKVDYIVTAPGTIEAFERVQVTARVAGVVDKVAFSEGQEVKRGDVLVMIDSERYRLAQNSSKAAVEKAQAAQKDVEGQVSRREGAMADHPGLIPGEELETYRTKTLTAKADTSVAQEALKVADLNLRDSMVRSPIDGVIQTRTVETGQYVNSGGIMATLLNANPMLLKFNVETSDAPRLKPGMTATFTMRESQQTWQAKITLVSAAADPTTHMVAITGEISNTDHKYWLRPGAFADVSIDVGGTRNSPLIPRFAMRATDHGYVTYAVENDVAVERVITVGMSTRDGWVEIRSGLKDGDWIVVRGAEALTPGAKLRQTKYLSLDAGVAPIEDQNQQGGGGGWDGGAGRKRAPGAASGSAGGEHSGGGGGRNHGAASSAPPASGAAAP